MPVDHPDLVHAIVLVGQAGDALGPGWVGQEADEVAGRIPEEVEQRVGGHGRLELRRAPGDHPAGEAELALDGVLDRGGRPAADFCGQEKTALPLCR